MLYQINLVTATFLVVVIMIVVSAAFTVMIVVMIMMMAGSIRVEGQLSGEEGLHRRIGTAGANCFAD